MKNRIYFKVWSNDCGSMAFNQCDYTNAASCVPSSKIEAAAAQSVNVGGSYSWLYFLHKNTELGTPGDS